MQSAIAPDGKTAISASWDHTLKIWETETGGELKTLTGHSDSVCAVAIAPDGKTAISASFDNTLKIWDTGDRELKTLTGHSDWVWAVAIAPNRPNSDFRFIGSYPENLEHQKTRQGTENSYGSY